MKRKVPILTFTLLFFLSTTALPVSLHFCQMSQDEEVCGHIMVKKTSCCEEETNNKIFVTKAGEQCCTDHVIDKTLKDNFISSKNDNGNFNSFKFLPVILLSVEFTSHFEKVSCLNKDISPPDLQSNNLYLENSVFLI